MAGMSHQTPHLNFWQWTQMFCLPGPRWLCIYREQMGNQERHSLRNGEEGPRTLWKLMQSDLWRHIEPPFYLTLSVHETKTNERATPVCCVQAWNARCETGIPIQGRETSVSKTGTFDLNPIWHLIGCQPEGCEERIPNKKQSSKVRQHRFKRGFQWFEPRVSFMKWCPGPCWTEELPLL